MKKITISNELIQQKAVLDEKIYLSDLPEFRNGDLSILYNTVFNKSITGIGGTSLALDSEESIIILMPFIEVVNNKEGYNPDTFIVKGGVSTSAIIRYLKNTKVRKIVSTYDGLRKIIDAYSKANLNVFDDFVLIDEWQVLFKQYGLRYRAFRYLLDESVKFKKRCFMTATPIKKEYWFPELNGLTELVLDYDIEPVSIYHYNSRNIIDETIAIINSKSVDNNFHFFINSVDTIKSITKTLKINPEDVRIVCSKQDKNEAKLTGYKIESTKNPVKPLNFYTSTCFEGCDIYDENGKVFVLCDGQKAHSLVDISTTLPQIAGRIRDIKDSSINLIYTNSRYIDVTEEEFNERVDKNIQIGRNIMNDIQSKDTLEVLDDMKLNDRYLIIKDDKVVFEEILLNIDKANFETSKTYSFKANISAKLSTQFTPIKIVRPWAEEVEKFEEEKFKKLSFKGQCLVYAELSEHTFSIVPDFSKEVIDAVDILGIERLKELNFHKGDISRALVSRMNTSEEIKVFKCLRLTKGEFYASNQLKTIFQSIYNDLELNKKAKGTDIRNYYEVKTTTKKIDGKTTKGFIIITQKIKF